MNKNAVVYKDAGYELGQKDEKPYLAVDGRIYMLTCHPYEPCLYITDENGSKTAVHNAFDPHNVLAFAQSGAVFSSITGFEYDARDFCVMVAFAAGKGDVGIETAEKVFGNRAKKKAAGTAKPSAGKTLSQTGVFSVPAGVSLIEEDPFYDLANTYPDNVIDYCLVKCDPACSGIDLHRTALMRAAQKIIAEDYELQFSAEKITAEKISEKELFAPAGGIGETLNYRSAFLSPPYPGGYTDADFERLNDVLFPNGRAQLEIYAWSTDWSDYFDEGREWWGTLCCTVYDKSMDRFVVIMASATD